MSKFGERIKDLAKKLGKENQEVAEDLGLSKSQMSHYTTGKRKVPSDLLQKIVDTYSINPQFLFRENVPLYKENNDDNSKKVSSKYNYYPVSISAGLPINVDGITNDDVEQISIPDSIMKGHAGSKDVFFMKTNGESMNNVIPHDSLIAVKHTDINNLKNGDIVVYSCNHEYSVKRIYNDANNKRFVFKPDSTDMRFIDNVVTYEEAKDLKLYGKVVLYIVNLD